MTGYNHPASCTCGWCIGGWRNHGSRSASEPRREPVWTVRWTYDSFTIPNVTCRFCNALVFYHEAWNGGRVFFDALGPPWPKHQCMGGASHETPRLLSVEERSAIVAPTAAWRSDGWTPIAVELISREDEWYVLKCHRLEDGSFLRLLSTSPIDGLRRAPTLLSPMSECGRATISYLHPDGTPRETLVYDYGTHCLSTPLEVSAVEGGSPH